MRIKRQILKVAVLGALLGLAGLADAAVPAGSLPGSFQSNVSATYNGSGSAGTITYNSNAQIVMQWGGTPDIQTQAVSAPSGITTNAGFDIGQGATLNIVNQGNTGTQVLVVDATGNPSEIAGTIGVSSPNSGGAPSLVIANANGVTLDGTAVVNAPYVNVLGYAVDPASYIAANGAITINGSTPTNNGAVTVASGVQFNGTSELLVAGNGAVNIGASNITGNNSAGNYFVASAGEGVKITTDITSGQGVINPNAVLTLSGGSASAPMELDGAQGGVVNVTGDIAGDPNGTSNTGGAGDLFLMLTNGLNIAQGATASGSLVAISGLPEQAGQAAGDVTIAGSLDAANAIQFNDVNNVYESGSGTVNVAGGTNIYANIYGNMANPSGGQAHGGDWRYNGFVVNVNPDGSTASYADTVGLVINPLSLGAKQQFINIAVNGSANLFNWNMQGAIPANLVSSPLSGGGSVAAQAPAVTATDHLVVTANNIVLGNPNFNAVNYYFPGLLALVTDSAGDPTTVGGGRITVAGSVSNVVPWSIPNGGGMYLTTNTLALSSGSTFLVNDNSYVNFPASKYTAQYALFPNTFYGAVNNGSSLGTQALPAGDFNTYGAWNDPSAG